MQKPPAVVLLSGGLDSATCLAIAADQFQPVCISFDYGQRHYAELRAAEQLAAAYDAPHRIIAVDLRQIGGSALTDHLPVPKHDSADQLDPSTIPPTYVPARNTIFLAFALAVAELTGADNLFTGVNALDYSGYPDCRPEYIAAFERMAKLATARALEHGLTVRTPLITLTKRQIIALGLELGVDYSLTWSCYDPQPSSSGDRRLGMVTGVRPCGRCDSCLLRAKGFEENGVADPALAPA